LETFSEPGDTVADIFAGSGMTGVAARITGRNALISDISVLGKHVGEGYLATVDSQEFLKVAEEIMAAARKQIDNMYTTYRAADGKECEIIRTIWSFVYECSTCNKEIIYYEAMKLNSWQAPTVCPHCDSSFTKRGSNYVRDVPVIVVVIGGNGKQIEQPICAYDLQKIAEARESRELELVPSKRIDPNREMYRRSALKKWRLEETRDFFSPRNALALHHLWKQINAISSKPIRQKLRFAFTAILPRASRRYQWSPQRPLNAANQTYYIAPIYYEWNVFDLFERKITAALRSDEEIESRRKLFNKKNTTSQTYVLSSASSLSHLDDATIDYVFTDPPFGSNLFYSDMSLFQEAWLGEITNDSEEAVIHTGGAKGAASSKRYEDLLQLACNEAFRVLKPGKCLSLVFGNSNGRVWSMVQRILRDSGFELTPIHIGILDKGQRSVKGLASGSEGVTTLDLILTVRKPFLKVGNPSVVSVPPALDDVVHDALANIDFDVHVSPSHIYLMLLKRAFELGISVDQLHLADVLNWLEKQGIRVNKKTGLLEKENHSSALLAG
jgi:16S rRNA G966 N2-methylase RsmD/DNA-directed RNA polymerase subunit RPC12/RpoP